MFVPYPWGLANELRRQSRSFQEGFIEGVRREKENQKKFKYLKRDRNLHCDRENTERIMSYYEIGDFYKCPTCGFQISMQVVLARNNELNQ